MVVRPGRRGNLPHRPGRVERLAGVGGQQLRQALDRLVVVAAGHLQADQRLADRHASGLLVHGRGENLLPCAVAPSFCETSAIASASVVSFLPEPMYAVQIFSGSSLLPVAIVSDCASGANCACCAGWEAISRISVCARS